MREKSNSYIVAENTLMKKNTQKILLTLFNTINTSSSERLINSKASLQEKSKDISGVIQPKNSYGRVGVKQESIGLVTPQLSNGGRRSLLYTLKQKGVINSEKVLGTTWLSLTSYGLQLLEAQFPALSSSWKVWQGEWDCLVFLKPPKLDQSFRYLRSLLLSAKAVSVTRGVYFLPSLFSEQVTKECWGSYRDSVLIFSIAKWKLANLRRLVIEKYGLLDLIDSYSGVSKEIDKLLKEIDTEKGLTQSRKQEINLVYNRLRDLLIEDLGFTTYYFPQTISGRELLTRLNQVLTN